MTEPADLERRLDRALRNLPTPRAPGSLVTRVLAAVEPAATPVRRSRGWRAWPRRWQVSALVALCIIAGAIVWLPWLTTLVSAANGGAIAASVSARADQLTLAATALRLVWDVTVQPFMPYVVGLAVLMGAAFAILGITLTYVASGRTWEQ